MTIPFGTAGMVIFLPALWNSIHFEYSFCNGEFYIQLSRSHSGSAEQSRDGLIQPEVSFSMSLKK
jgi:hypothetical protein